MFLRVQNNGLGAVSRAVAFRRGLAVVPRRRGLRGLGAIGFGPGECPMISDGRCTNNPGSTNAADYYDCASVRECDPYTGRQHYEYQILGDAGMRNANTWYLQANGSWVWLDANGRPATPPAGAPPQPDLADGAYATPPAYQFGGGGSGGTGTGFTPIPGTQWCRNNATGSVGACPVAAAPAGSLEHLLGNGGDQLRAQVFPRTVSIANARGGSAFQVGDDWTITVKGDPGQRVSASATQDGQSLGESAYGVTDSQGVFVLRGRMTPDTVGQWTEQWKVAGETVGSLSFRVSPASTPAPAGTRAPAPPAGSPPTGSFLDNLLPAGAASGFDLSFFSKPVSLFGFSVPLGGLLAAGAVGLYLAKGRR